MIIQVLHVSIPVWCDQEKALKLKSDEDLASFNSSMVRLGGAITTKAAAIVSMFQFQYGAIRRTYEFQAILFRHQFQFQYGAIRRKNMNFQANGTN